MDDADLQLATQVGLVRPDVTHSEIIRFRRERRAAVDAAPERIALDGLRRERVRLQQRRRQMIQELLRIRQRERDIDGILGEK